jgi:hypothetical protein
MLLTSPRTTTVTASVRGNLGPPSVVVEDSVKDWLKDRWQAASDMHGTAIQGPHWIQLDFRASVIIDKILLDWEAAYSDDYSYSLGVATTIKPPLSTTRQRSLHHQ